MKFYKSPVNENTINELVLYTRESETLNNKCIDVCKKLKASREGGGALSNVAIMDMWCKIAHKAHRAYLREKGLSNPIVGIKLNPETIKRLTSELNESYTYDLMFMVAKEQIENNAKITA